MKSSCWIIIMCLVRLSEEICTNNPSPASCSSRSLSLTTTIDGAAYCRCLTCPGGKFMDSRTISCCSSNANCVTCLGSSTGACTLCVAGAVIVGTGCQLCSSVMPNCISCNASNVCLSCASSNYALNGNACPLCSTVLPHCQSCSSISLCTSCVSNSYILSGGNCPACSSFLPNCNTCITNTTCISCISASYILNAGSCIGCSSFLPNCLACSSNTVCTSCVNNSYTFNGSSCALCSTFLSSCLTCSSNTTCTQCKNNSWILNMGACIYCGHVLQFCSTCSSTTVCTQCDPAGYRLPNLTCLLCTFPINFCYRCTYHLPNSSVTCDQCDAFHTIDPISGYCFSCQSVMTACSICYSSNTYCSACNRDTFAVNVNSIPQHCQPCNATLTYCIRCLNDNLCIQCIANPTIFLNRMANFTNSFVSGGYYHANSYTGTSGDCRFCNISYSHCVTCNSSQCLTCVTNPSITFITGTFCDFCRNILFACELCISEFLCSKCKNSFFTLVTVSPTSRICKLCCDMMAGCLLCISPTVCISCSVGFQVQGGCSASAGCLQVILSGQRSSLCISCEPTEFHPTPINGTCLCRYGRTAGKYCTSIIGCQVISRTLNRDVCSNCETNRHFALENGLCKCIDHYHLVENNCIDICGDGLIFEDQCDDGNQFDLDGCSSKCKIEDSYECSGGSQTSISLCKLSKRIHISISEIRKEPDSNSLVVFLKVSHPTRHLMRINFPSALRYEPTNLLELTNIETTSEYVKLSFNYFQDLYQILAKVFIKLDTNYFYENELHQSFLLQATSGEVLYYDKWAGSEYSDIEQPLLYLGIGALVVSIAGTISYKMIGVETLHTIQLVFMGMIFSKRYSNYFHHFDLLFIPFGQSSIIQENYKSQVPHRLAFMKYSTRFQNNLVIVGAILCLCFFICIATNFIWLLVKKKMKENEKKNLKEIKERKQDFKKFNLITRQYILLPLGLGFFFHILFSIIFQSFNFPASKGIGFSLLIAFFKIALISTFAWIIFDEVKRGFITFLKYNPSIKYRGALQFAQPLLPHEAVHLYSPLFTVNTILIGIYTAVSALLNIKYYIEVNLALSLLRIILIAVLKPYQFSFHNAALFFNASVVLLAYVWLTLEQFYLLNPTITKLIAMFMISCLAAVELLAVFRVAYNVWSKYRQPSNSSMKEKPAQSTEVEKLAHSKSEMERLLSKQTLKFGKQSKERVGWKKKGMFKPQNDLEKKNMLNEFIKKSKETFSLNMKIKRSKALATQGK